MILAGDIGGTKTVLALVTQEKGVAQPLAEERYPSQEHDSLESIVEKFLTKTNAKPSAATFGVAGWIIGRQAHITNLPWTINADSLSEQFNIATVHLLNDLQAVATAVPHLGPDELFTVQEGTAVPEGVIGVIAPGTGLGEAFLTWTGNRYKAWPTEGGHVSFAPNSHEQLELLEYLERQFGHVSFERVCSGIGLPNIYNYLVASGRYEEPDWLRREILETKDPNPVIVTAGIERRAPICIAAVDLFVRILGNATGNMALKFFASGGLYIGGGIPPRILDRLKQNDFTDAICYKGRFREWVSQIPVHVILDPKAALHGAAWDALDSEG